VRRQTNKRRRFVSISPSSPPCPSRNPRPSVGRFHPSQENHGGFLPSARPHARHRDRGLEGFRLLENFAPGARRSSQIGPSELGSRSRLPRNGRGTHPTRDLRRLHEWRLVERQPCGHDLTFGSEARDGQGLRILVRRAGETGTSEKNAPDTLQVMVRKRKPFFPPPPHLPPSGLNLIPRQVRSSEPRSFPLRSRPEPSRRAIATARTRRRYRAPSPAGAWP